MNLPKLVCIAGLAVVVCQECGNNSNGTFPLAISVLVYAILAVLRESIAAITNISEVLGSYIQKVMVFDNKEKNNEMRRSITEYDHARRDYSSSLLHSSRDDNICSKRFGGKTHKCLYIPLRGRLCFLD